MRLLWGIVCMVLVSYSGNVVTRERASMVRLELTERTTHQTARSPDDPVKGLRAFLEINRVQPDVSQGVVFTIEIVNEGTIPVNLVDPSEYVDLQLKNEQGWTCNYPRSRRMRIGKASGTRYPKSEIRLTNPKPYVVIKDALHASVPSVKTLADLKNWQILLEPGDSFRFSLRIEKVIVPPRDHSLNQYGRERDPHSPTFKEETAHNPPPKAQLLSIPAGIYKLRGYLLLCPKTYLSHKILKWDDVVVQLGPLTDSD